MEETRTTLGERVGVKHRVQIPLRHFFATPPTPCPYIPGRLERKVVTLLATDEPDKLHDALSQAGFRRSQDLAYRPACDECSACVPVRVPAADFAPSRGHRRILAANDGVTLREVPSLATREHYFLFRRYILARHAGLRVLGLSLLTNMGAGLSTETLSHAHTLHAAHASAATAARLLAAIVPALQL